jgi:hypothetical protein
VPVPSSAYRTYGTAKYWSTTVPWRLRYNTTLCLYRCLRTILMVLPSTGSTTVPWWRLHFRYQRELLRYSCCACTIVYILYSWCCQVLGRVRTTTVPWRLPYNTMPVLYSCLSCCCCVIAHDCIFHLSISLPPLLLLP